MRRRPCVVVMVLSIVTGTIVVLSSAADATKVVERYKSNTKELKSECADGGGEYVETKDGTLGTCHWPDGTDTFCDNKKKGKNCSTYSRVVTDDGRFLHFVGVALVDPSSVTVVAADDTGASGGEHRESTKSVIRRLLAKEDFTMTAGRLERTCTNANSDLVMSNDESGAVCMGRSSTIFCDSEKQRRNCTIEAITSRTRAVMRLLRHALVNPSSVTILVAPEGAAPSPSGGRRTTSSTTPSSTTPLSTTPSSVTTNPPATTTTSTSTTTTTGPAFL